ncbi:MAG: exodeoxyribonuclease III [Burkholderiaceae bacterium]|nr:exodeoxyribonuclease III [Burkholderiaceae bacterium]
MPTTLATWNVNSLKVRLPHLIDWLAAHPIDIVCLQETKLTDDRFPADELAKVGYRSVYAGQRTYNGVAILLRDGAVGAPTDVQINLPNFEDEQKRLLAVTLDGLRVVCAYFPNGQAVGSDKYEYKLRWIAALTDWLKGELSRHEKLALAGDFNIAPEPRDVHDPVLWDGQVLFSEPERAAFRALLDLGLRDAFRLFEQPERSFTWWDYRNMAFRRKWGLRIDHILVSPALAAQCTACTIDVEPRRRPQPSDHAPVIATFG